VDVVKATTQNIEVTIEPLFSPSEIIQLQKLIRKIPIADNVIEYAVTLVSKTRPNTEKSSDFINTYVDWGAGPRASQNLVLAAKTHAASRGKYSPDIEDIQAVAISILRHRVVRNYKAEAENISIEDIIQKLL
jgi:MoxR-like ATPase